MGEPMDWTIEQVLKQLDIEKAVVQQVMSLEELKVGVTFVHIGDRYAGYQPFKAEVIAETTVNAYKSTSMKIKLHSAHADLGNVDEVIDYCVVWSQEEVGFDHDDIELERIYKLAQEDGEGEVA